MQRREFLTKAPLVSLVPNVIRGIDGREHKVPSPTAELFFTSVSQWSYHRAILGSSRSNYDWFIRTLHESPADVLLGDMEPWDIIDKAQELGVSHVDLVNILFFGHMNDEAWLAEFETRARQSGVRFEVLMVDEAGHLGSSGRAQREDAVRRHIEWLKCARWLSCRSVRVNAYGDGSYLEQLNNCASSLKSLARVAQDMGLELLVENHGHPSSNGAWLAMLIEQTDHPNLGVMADFDNFFMGGWGHSPQRRYDTRQGMLDLAPYTRVLSAKSYDFNHEGQETTVDFEMCLRIMLDAGFRGAVSAEYEGELLGEHEGTHATLELLRGLKKKLSPEYQ